MANLLMRRDIAIKAKVKSRSIGFVRDARDIATLRSDEVVEAIEQLHSQPAGSFCDDPALRKFLRYIQVWGGSVPNSDQHKLAVRRQIYAMIPYFGSV